MAFWRGRRKSVKIAAKNEKMERALIEIARVAQTYRPNEQASQQILLLALSGLEAEDLSWEK